MKLFNRLLTRNFKSVPLYWIDFNYDHYKKYGKEGSCTAHLHPMLNDDEILKEKIKDITDYIRDNYDMDDIV